MAARSVDGLSGDGPTSGDRRILGQRKGAHWPFDGGSIALVRDGDTISLDVPACKLDVQVGEDELGRRRAAWQRPAPHYTEGILAKYAALVSGADRGAVCTVPAAG